MQNDKKPQQLLRYVHELMAHGTWQMEIVLWPKNTLDKIAHTNKTKNKLTKYVYYSLTNTK